MWKGMCLVGALVLIVVSLACAPRVLELHQVRFLCMQSDTGDSDEGMFGSACASGDRRDICRAYHNAAAGNHADAAACVAACRAAEADLRVRFLMSSCNPVVNSGATICKRYCLGHYPEE